MYCIKVAAGDNHTIALTAAGKVVSLHITICLLSFSQKLIIDSDSILQRI